MAMITDNDEVTKNSLADGICFCRVCKSLVFCYLACLAIPLILLTGIMAIVLGAIFG